MTTCQVSFFHKSQCKDGGHDGTEGGTTLDGSFIEVKQFCAQHWRRSNWHEITTGKQRGPATGSAQYPSNKILGGGRGFGVPRHFCVQTYDVGSGCRSCTRKAAGRGSNSLRAKRKQGRDQQSPPGERFQSECTSTLLRW